MAYTLLEGAGLRVRAGPCHIMSCCAVRYVRPCLAVWTAGGGGVQKCVRACGQWHKFACLVRVAHSANKQLAHSRRLPCCVPLDVPACPPPFHAQPGDAVILNAANSSVGQVLLQLARLLRLRTVAVVRPPAQPHAAAAAAAATAGHKGPPAPAAARSATMTPSGAASAAGTTTASGSGGGAGAGGGSGDSKWDRTAAWLRGLGATEVLKDEGSLRVRAPGVQQPYLALPVPGSPRPRCMMPARSRTHPPANHRPTWTGCTSTRGRGWRWMQWGATQRRAWQMPWARCVWVCGVSGGVCVHTCVCVCVLRGLYGCSIPN